MITKAEKATPLSSSNTQGGLNEIESYEKIVTRAKTFCKSFLVTLACHEVIPWKIVHLLFKLFKLTDLFEHCTYKIHGNTTNNSISTSYEAGACIRIEIFKSGLREGILAQIRNIISNHEDSETTDFMLGLMGFNCHCEDCRSQAPLADYKKKEKLVCGSLHE